MYKHQFIVGRTYLTREGKPVKIIAENDPKMWPHYRCVQGDDGEGRWDDEWNSETRSMECKWFPGSNFGWRYDREGDIGRCTGSVPENPRNLMPGSEVNADMAVLGILFLQKVSASFNELGVYRTAKNLRKQGWSIGVVQRLLKAWSAR